MQKEAAELAHWRHELEHLRRWFIDGTEDWWGLPAPSDEQKLTASDLWATNGILTMHHLRATYWEELQLDGEALDGERVLEVGCGPLAPVLQFRGCERHGLDILIDAYLNAGWPLFDLDVRFVDAPAERMPYPDGWFDSVISVNALDHVDDFEATCREMERVLRPGGRMRFNVEYHKPTVTEPLELDDRRVEAAFERVPVRKVREVSAPELFRGIGERFGLPSSAPPQLGSGERYALWTGVKPGGMRSGEVKLANLSLRRP